MKDGTAHGECNNDNSKRSLATVDVVAFLITGTEHSCAPARIQVLSKNGQFYTLIHDRIPYSKCIIRMRPAIEEDAAVANV
jgi:hypothetical protein